jgi:hypothetical protein
LESSGERPDTSALPRAAASAEPARLLGIAAIQWPAIVTTLALVGMLLRYALAHGFHRATDFITIGVRFAAPYHLDGLATSPIGYDGQFTYFIARFPGDLPAPFDWTALRYSRMLPPLLVRLLSLGDADLMPWVLLALNIAAVAGTVALMTWLLRQRGLPAWLALASGLYCGQALALERDLGDPIAIFFIALALVGLERRRWLLAAAALGLGMLTRESTLVFALCFAAPLLIERRWHALAAYLATVFLPYLCWEALLYGWLGIWGFRQSSQTNAFAPLPFAGLAAQRDARLVAAMVVFACLPAAAAIVFGALALVGRPWRGDALRAGAALAAVVYGLAVLLQPGIHWLDIWEPMRLAAPLTLLLPLLPLLPLLAPGVPSSVARGLRAGGVQAARVAWTGLLVLLVVSLGVALTA